MEAPAPTDRLRWLLTLVVLGVGALGLILWWRARATPNAAMLLPAEISHDPQATTVAAGGTGEQIGVDVVGAVQRPGLYFFGASARVNDAVNAAGGFAPDADRSAINLALRLHDEQQLRIPHVGDQPAAVVQPPNSASPGATTVQPPNTAPPGAATAEPIGQPLQPGGRIDLNAADALTLEALPGIGRVMAQRIVDYRTTHGPFKSIDDLLNVTGIGTATLNSLRDHVIVIPIP